MVARFRADTLSDKGRCALQRPSLHSSSWFGFQLASGFCLGVIATFVWLLRDIETEHPGTWFHNTTCKLLASVIWYFYCNCSALRYIVTSAIFTGTIVDMGSAESQLAAGVFPGDSQRDEDSQQFLTPDLLERTWLDLDPSPDLDMPW